MTTFSQARAAIFEYIRKEDPRYYGLGFTVKPHLKEPQIITPSGHIIRFKAQAVYLGAHSLWIDIRKITPAQFLEAVMAREGSSSRDPKGIPRGKHAAHRISQAIRRNRRRQHRVPWTPFGGNESWRKHRALKATHRGHEIGRREREGRRRDPQRKHYGRDPDSLRERIAKALGWTVEETESFSLPALRDLVRSVNPKLASEISDHLAMGTHIRGGKRRITRRDPDGFERFHSWAEVLAHVNAGLPTWYHAPMDYKPVRIYGKVRGRKIRIAATSRENDPFTADSGHLSRFLKKGDAALVHGLDRDPGRRKRKHKRARVHKALSRKLRSRR